MDFLRQPIQRKLSEALGTPVEIEDLAVSPFKGVAVARGVRIAGDDPGQPLLRIEAIRFEISLAGIFQKRMIVKSLTIDRPVVHLRRRLDGSWNLPQRPADPASPSTDSEDGSTWTFDAEKTLLVGGQIRLSIELESGWYDLELDNLDGQTLREGSALRITLLGRHLHAGGRSIGAGEVKLAGTLTGFEDLRRILGSGLDGTLEIEPIARLLVRIPRLERRRVHLTLDSAVEAAELLALLPPLPALEAIKRLNLRGPLRFSTDLSAG